MASISMYWLKSFSKTCTELRIGLSTTCTFQCDVLFQLPHMTRLSFPSKWRIVPQTSARPRATSRLLHRANRNNLAECIGRAASCNSAQLKDMSRRDSRLGHGDSLVDIVTLPIGYYSTSHYKGKNASIESGWGKLQKGTKQHSDDYCRVFTLVLFIMFFPHQSRCFYEGTWDLSQL